MAKFIGTLHLHKIHAINMSSTSVKEEEGFKFLEEGDGPVLMLLHGLFGTLSNFEGIINHFSGKYKVVVPLLPIFEMPIGDVSLEGLLKYVEDFVAYRGYKSAHVLGNSLGGHIALLFGLGNPDFTKTITLTGSSGLFENSMGSTFPKRGDYEFIKKKTGETFFNPEVATKELVDEVFDIVNDRNKAIRVVYTAKSAIRHNLSDTLHQLKAATLLIWGQQDTITPPFVGEKFDELIPDSELHFLNECGHAPMMEKTNEFNSILSDFLDKH